MLTQSLQVARSTRSGRGATRSFARRLPATRRGRLATACLAACARRAGRTAASSVSPRSSSTVSRAGQRARIVQRRQLSLSRRCVRSYESVRGRGAVQQRVALGAPFALLSPLARRLKRCVWPVNHCTYHGRPFCFATARKASPTCVELTSFNARVYIVQSSAAPRHDAVRGQRARNPRPEQIRPHGGKQLDR
jgi:hypothetical protein